LHELVPAWTWTRPPNVSSRALVLNRIASLSCACSGAVIDNVAAITATPSTRLMSSLLWMSWPAADLPRVGTLRILLISVNVGMTGELPVTDL